MAAALGAPMVMHGNWHQRIGIILVSCWAVVHALRSEMDHSTVEKLASESERMEMFIDEYEKEGYHRTGSAVGRASAEHLAKILEAAGHGKANVSLQRFTFPMRTPQEAQVTIQSADGSWTATGYPTLDGSYTGLDGIAGTLGFPGSDCDVALVNYTDANMPLSNPGWKEAAGNNRHKAILAVYKPQGGGPTGLALVNAQNFPGSVGKPVLQVDGVFWGKLESAAAGSAHVEMVATVTEEQGEGINVQAEVLGSDPALAPVLIMTPRSGWWQCATERATGIAAFIEILRAVTSTEPQRSVYFLATDGHELNHIGSDHWQNTWPEFVEKSSLVMHIGANWGSQVRSSHFPINLLQVGKEAGLEGRATKVFTEVAGFDSKQMMIRSGSPLGEVREIANKTQRYVSLIGVQNPYFHLEGDTTANNLDMVILQRQLLAFRAFLLDQLSSRL